MGDRVAVMHDGRARAGGDTRTVYEQPGERVRAGFIGSPSMSFATLGVTAERRRLTCGRASLRLVDAAAFPELPAEVTSGSARAHAPVARRTNGLVGPVAGRRRYVEMLGRETLIGVDTGGGEHFTVLWRTPTRRSPRATRCGFGVQPGRVYLFDPATTDSLAIVESGRRTHPITPSFRAMRLGSGSPANDRLGVERAAEHRPPSPPPRDRAVDGDAAGMEGPHRETDGPAHRLCGEPPRRAPLVARSGNGSSVLVHAVFMPASARAYTWPTRSRARKRRRPDRVDGRRIFEG